MIVSPVHLVSYNMQFEKYAIKKYVVMWAFGNYKVLYDSLLLLS